MNEVVWDKRALKILKKFPREVKKTTGFLIRELQMGKKLNMPFSRPMPGIERNCHELRVRGVDGNYRIFYFLKIKNKIIIFHAFKKKTQKTRKIDLETGKRNLKEILNENNYN
ncbi:MAG: type II toxin-antitoxin system RelE/ParE family toxin [Halobacteriovoraceae bacterium]|nr:type II toxin-antitoxin system RelE/ParE family toxin [Halobacteriovoraceae bacterium]